jgi:hypothetical protein
MFTLHDQNVAFGNFGVAIGSELQAAIVGDAQHGDPQVLPPGRFTQRLPSHGGASIDDELAGDFVQVVEMGQVHIHAVHAGDGTRHIAPG